MSFGRITRHVPPDADDVRELRVRALDVLEAVRAGHEILRALLTACVRIGSSVE
jgi:hypothetical protein